MTESALKSVVEAVLDLPEANQAEVVEILRQYVEEQRSPSLLTEEQQAEVRRRLADPNPEYVDHDEVFDKIFARFGL